MRRPRSSPPLHPLPPLLAALSCAFALAACDASPGNLAGADAGPHCGDGNLERGEVCDDGAANGTYGHCRTDCTGQGPSCGDLTVDAPAEACDDGRDNGTYGHCAAGCQGPGERCGDGVLQRDRERCDDGAANGTYGHCAAGCQALGPRCGDAQVEPGVEVCDEGLANGTYGHCAADCKGPGARCGDGTVQAPEEKCDDGALNGTTAHCRVDCQGLGLPCGDGHVNPRAGEECDLGADNGRYNCDTMCRWGGFPPPPSPGNVPAGWVESPPACTPDGWLAKYLGYRLRFRGDGTAANPGFIALGAGPGMSVPITKHEPAADCATAWQLENCHRPGTGRLEWGDATIWLGEYLAVLGTERKAFQLIGLPVAQTTQDLSFALQAVNRLDTVAEVKLGYPASLDGFFIRDDVTNDLLLLPGGGPRFPLAAPGVTGYGCVSGSSACGAPTIAGGSFESLDQAMGLVWGLTVLWAVLPDGVVVDGVDLRHEARAIVHRIVSRLRDNNWHVRAPDGSTPPAEWGGNAIAFSNQLAKAANRVCGTDFGVADYRTATSRVEGEAVFAALIAGWDATFNYNRTMGLRAAAMAGEWDADTMSRRASDDVKEGYALSWALVNGPPIGTGIAPWRIESMLSSAPCGGPCHGTQGCPDTPGWMGESRQMNSPDRFGSRHDGRVEFNGLDYMFVHNAWLVLRQGRYDYATLESTPSGCDGARGLDAILAGPVNGEGFDPGARCSMADLGRRFCGRSLAGWIVAARAGEASIFTANARWTCPATGACTLATGATPGTAGADLILGSAGADNLNGGDGDDCIYGLGGNDVLRGGRGADEIHGGDGDDEIYGETSASDLSGEPDRLFGEAGNDRIQGGPGRDELYGGPGDDELIGGASDDSIAGGEGNDYIEGGTGDDHVLGGPGDDTIYGGSGDDVVWGGDGRDKLDGEGGDDALWSGAGDNFLKGGDGADTLVGEGAHDRLCGNGGDDTIWANWDGLDQCRGGGPILGGTDTVNGCTDDTATQEQCSDGAFSSW